MNIIEITNLENRWSYRYVRTSCMLLEHLKPNLCNYRGPFTKHFYWVLTSFQPMTNLCEITVGSHPTLSLVTNRVLSQLHRHLLYQQLQLSLLNAVVGIATSTCMGICILQWGHVFALWSKQVSCFWSFISTQKSLFQWVNPSKICQYALNLNQVQKQPEYC